MCWDISLHTDIEIIKATFPQIRDERLNLEYNYSLMENVQAIGFPNYPIIYKEKDSGLITLQEMEWGIFPTFAKTEKEQVDRRRNMVNIRSERVLGDKKSMWYRLRKQRCLIPVSGIFEHRQVTGWKKKVPYYVAEKGRSYFLIPGLYQFHELINPDGEIQKIGTFGLITRHANELMSNIHNAGDNKHRMPLFLPNAFEMKWLEEIDEEGMSEIFKYEMPSSELDSVPVYTLRGYPNRPDGKHRYEKFDWPRLPPLGQDFVQESLF